MSDEEIISFYEELKAHYKDSLVNFEHYPRQFATQVRLYKYYKAREAEAEKVVDPSENVVDFTQEA
jgi:hypothetical protein